MQEGNENNSKINVMFFYIISLHSIVLKYNYFFIFLISVIYQISFIKNKSILNSYLFKQKTNH